MEKNYILKALPDKLITEVMGYLEAKDVFLSFRLSSRQVNSLFNRSPYLQDLEYAFLSRKIGRRTRASKNILSRMIKDPKQRLFRLRYVLNNIANGLLEEIPFFGFESTGGLYKNDEDNWISRKFVLSQGISFSNAKNFVIKAGFNRNPQGKIVNTDMTGEIKKNIVNEFVSATVSNHEAVSIDSILEICRPVDHIFIMELLSGQTLTGLDPSFYARAVEKYESEHNTSRQEIIQVLKATERYFLFDLKNLMKAENNERFIRDEGFRADDSKIAILNSVFISRSINKTPIKSCAIFASDFDVDLNTSSLIKMFDSIKNPLDFCELYKNQKHALPFIYKTNIGDLSKESDSFDKQPKPFDYVVFKNDQPDCPLKIMVWLAFSSPFVTSATIDFGGNFFSGTYVLCKLIDSDLTNLYNMDGEEGNSIEFECLSFKGGLYAITDEKD